VAALIYVLPALPVVRNANSLPARPTASSLALPNVLTPLAFTAHLAVELQVVGVPDPVETRTQVDNGRMPVFDLAGAHRLPASGTAQDQPGDLQRLP